MRQEADETLTGRGGGYLRQPGYLQQDLLVVLCPIRALKPKQVSISAAALRREQLVPERQVPKCHVCSGGASLGGEGCEELPEARGRGAEPGGSLLACSWGWLGVLLIPAVLLLWYLRHHSLLFCVLTPRRVWDLPEQRRDLHV